MKRRSARKVLLGLQWNGPAWDSAPRWCETLLPRLERTPIHWSFPSPPSDRDWTEEPFIRTLRGRLESPGDTMLPVGFKGAYHSLLTLDELEKELSWSLRNPWSTGVTDLFRITPSAMAPRSPDFDRKPAFDLYSRMGFKWIGIERRGPHVPRIEGVTVFSYVKVAYSEEPRAGIRRNILRALGADRDLFIIIDVSSFPSMERLDGFVVELLDSLSTARVDFAVLESLKPGSLQKKAAEPRNLAWAVPAHLIRERMLFVSEYANRKRKKNDDYRTVLDSLSFHDMTVEESKEANGKERMEKRKRDITLVAHMQGEISLAGKDFDVRLTGGRFCGLVKQGTFIMPNAPARSNITISGKTYSFKTRSAISFEGDSGTGLRDELTMENSENGRLTIEYEFREDFPELFISTIMKFPTLTQDQCLDCFAPLVLSLRELGRDDPAVLRVVCPDGSEAIHRMTEREGWKPVPGMTWCVEIPEGRILLHSALPAEKRWGLCFFHVAKKRGRRIFEVDPFGSHVPVSGRLRSGKTEALSILVGLEEKPRGAA